MILEPVLRHTHEKDDDDLKNRSVGEMWNWSMTTESFLWNTSIIHAWYFDYIRSRQSSNAHARRSTMLSTSQFQNLHPLTWKRVDHTRVIILLHRIIDARKNKVPFAKEAQCRRHLWKKFIVKCVSAFLAWGSDEIRQTPTTLSHLRQRDLPNCRVLTTVQKRGGWIDQLQRQAPPIKSKDVRFDRNYSVETRGAEPARDSQSHRQVKVDHRRLYKRPRGRSNFILQRTASADIPALTFKIYTRLVWSTIDAGQ